MYMCIHAITIMYMLTLSFMSVSRNFHSVMSTVDRSDKRPIIWNEFYDGLENSILNMHLKASSTYQNYNIKNIPFTDSDCSSKSGQCDEDIGGKVPMLMDQHEVTRPCTHVPHGDIAHHEQVLTQDFKRGGGVVKEYFHQSRDAHTGTHYKDTGGYLWRERYMLVTIDYIITASRKISCNTVAEKQIVT